MVDLSIIYSKTGKGLRARNAADAGLSTKQLKLLSFVDGKSKAEEILTQSNEFNEKELASALKLLEMDGFIRLLATQSKADDWILTSNFTPMVVEEFKTVEEIEAEARDKAEQEKQEAERIAEEKSKEKIRWKAEINARKEAEAKNTVRLEQERIAREALVARKKQDDQQRRDNEARAKAEEEIKLKTQAEAERKVQEEADRLASAEAEKNARREIDRINREAAQAQKEAEEQAKIEVQGQEQKRLEIERIAQEAAREAEIAKKKVEAEAQLKMEEIRLETERLEKAKQAQLEAERIAKAENEAQLETARKAKAERKAQEATELERIKLAEKEKSEAVSKEAARLEMARVVRKAEEKRKQAESAAKEARQEAKRKIKAEEQARIKATRKAKDDAEQAHVDAEAAEKNKIALQQVAQLEMERLAREAENAEIIAEETKKNLEALQLVEAEQARLQTTRIVAEQAELQAEEQRQIEAEQVQKDIIEQQLAAQQAQEKAEKIRAKYDAEEKAALDAKELARQEMARIAREADALRSQTDSAILTKPTKNWRFEASRTAKLKKASLASQKNQESQKNEAEKKAQKVATRQARKAANQAYIDEKQTLSPAKHQESSSEIPTSKRTPIDLNSSFLNSAKWFVKLVKTTLIVGFILALLLIGALHFINISPLIAPIEKLATEGFGKPVTIKEVRASLWPQPHLMLSDISIGETLKATSMQVMPDTGTLFEDFKRVKSLAIEGLVIDQGNVKESLALIHNIGKAQSLKVEQLNLSDLRFKVKDLMIGPFDGNLLLNEARELSSVNLHGIDQSLSVQIKPQAMDYAITLSGTNWPLPLNPKIVFDELKANANIHQNQMTFSQINGAMFGGNISGNALLDWTSGWHTTGNFTLADANAPQLLKAFASKASVDGKASIEGKVSVTGGFSSQSTEVLKLTDAPTIMANIALKNGKINGVDLAHAVMFNQNASLAGEATTFDKLTANLQVKDSQYHYKQIMLDTKQFHANGNVDIAQNQAVSGRVNAALVAQSRRLQASFGLAGTVSDVKRQ